MTKKEIIERLESISSQIDHLEKMVEERSAQTKHAMFNKMESNEHQLERKIRKLEISYEKNNQQSNLGKAI